MTPKQYQSLTTHLQALNWMLKLKLHLVYVS